MNNSTLQTAKILIVDDDRRLLTALSAQLAKIGCACIACSNASEAMVQFAAGGFDVVITDLTMPGMDGLSVVGMVRSQSDIPILVVTGHSDDYGPAVTRYRNVTLFRKPYDVRALMALVRSILTEIPAATDQRRCG